MPSFTAIHVTNHALERWRQRVALYGDAKVHEILAALESAVEIPQDELLLIRRAGDRYYRDNNGTHFVVEVVSQGHVRLVTVLTQEQVYGKVAPVAKEAKPGHDEASKLAWLAQAEVFADEPAGLDYSGRHNWLQTQVSLVTTRMTTAAKLDRELAWKTMNILRGKLLYYQERRNVLKNERLASKFPKRWALPGVEAQPCGT